MLMKDWVNTEGALQAMNLEELAEHLGPSSPAMKELQAQVKTFFLKAPHPPGACFAAQPDLVMRTLDTVTSRSQ